MNERVDEWMNGWMRDVCGACGVCGARRFPPSNPPWGKNMGKPEDGGPIVLSVRRASSRIGPPETSNAPRTGGHDVCLFVWGWLLRRFAVSFEA